MPAPKRYVMKPNHSTRTPTQLVFFDTETEVDKRRSSRRKTVLRWRLGCAVAVRNDGPEPDRRKELRTTSLREFWRWLQALESRHRPVWVFSHNLGFDLTIARFFTRLEDGDYRVTAPGSDTPDERGRKKRAFRGRLVLEGRPTYCYTMGKAGRVNFIDTCNYWPVSLDTLGSSVGVPKWVMPDPAEDDETWLNYCMNDVRVLETAVLALMRNWYDDDCGCWQPTAATMALASWKHISPRVDKEHHKYPLWIDHTEAPMALERESYYGGQVEAWYIGRVQESFSKNGRWRTRGEDKMDTKPRGPLYHLDARGLYPAMMAEHWYPRERRWFKRACSVEKLKCHIDCSGAVARVRINSWTDLYPTRHNGHQVHARGRFWTTLAGPELARALRAGHVEEVREHAVYSLAPLFTKWVQYWDKRLTEARAKGDKADAAYCKMILVSLSGKFAQHGMSWKERPEIPCQLTWGTWYTIDPDQERRVERRGVAGITQELVDGDDPIHAFPAISAFITAHAREHMRFLRGLCPERSVLYQATDGLIVTAAGYEALNAAGWIQEGKLGFLECRGIYDEGEILGCNYYRLGDKWCRSGSWGRARQRPDGSWYYQAWQSLSATISSRPDGTIKIIETDLTNTTPYEKGPVGPDGWVLPLELNLELAERF